MTERNRRKRVWRWLAGLMGDRKDSGYSPISPRKPDGTRAPIFPFNGSGLGR